MTEISAEDDPCCVLGNPGSAMPSGAGTREPKEQIEIKAQLLALGLAEAVAKDEAPEIGGFDLSGGMFGPNVSAWLREVAAGLIE